MVGTVAYAVVKKNGKYGPKQEMGTPWHVSCLYQWDRSYVDKYFSVVDIAPSALRGKRCGFCNDNWEPDPKRLDPILASPAQPCLCCPPKPMVFPMDGVIAVGFGSAFVSRDGEIVLDGEMSRKEGGDPVTGADAERVAALDPDHDWRIVLDGPMGGQVYQRHGEEQWVYVKRLPGFA